MGEEERVGDVSFIDVRVQDLANIPDSVRWNLPSHTPIRRICERWVGRAELLYEPSNIELHHNGRELDKNSTLGETVVRNGDVIFVHYNESNYASGSDSSVSW